MSRYFVLMSASLTLLGAFDRTGIFIFSLFHAKLLVVCNAGVLLPVVLMMLYPPLLICIYYLLLGLADLPTSLLQVKASLCVRTLAFLG